jgi:hypothetical protein
MRIVVVEIAMFAVTGLRLVEKRLQRVARDLFWNNFSFLIYKYIHDGEEQMNIVNFRQQQQHIFILFCCLVF